MLYLCSKWKITENIRETIEVLWYNRHIDLLKTDSWMTQLTKVKHEDSDGV